MNALEIIGLSKKFGGLTVLDNITISVKPGEKRAIIGPNGAGKTTLFNAICGVTKVDTGEIYILNQKVTNLSPYRRARLGLARTFQQNNLFFNLSLLENINLAWKTGKSYSSQQEFLERWDWWEKRNILVKELSYGEQRQIELLLALSQSPRLLLLDEPTAGMSTAESEIITEMIRTLPSELAILIIEHDMDVVFNLADRITVLNYGQILFEGTQEEVKSNEHVKEVYLGTEIKEAGRSC